MAALEKKTLLPVRLADKLQTYIKKNNFASLPNLTQLSENFAASKSSMHAAVALLKRDGILSVRRGGKIRVTAAKASVISGNKIPAPQRAFEVMRKAISEGAVVAGQTLSKISVTARQMHVSNSTVVAAYRMLSARGLAHRAGKIWVAGPEISKWNTGHAQRPPVILVLLKDQNSWRFLGDTRTRNFRAVFEQEAARLGVQLVPVFFWLWASFRGLYTGGAAEVMELAQSLGDRYLGTLIVDSAFDEIPDAMALVNTLCSLKNPVVWFDRYDKPLHGHIDSQSFVRCYYSELPAINKAVSFLSGMGHRYAVYPCLDYHERWRLQRLDMLQKSGALQPMTLEIEGVFSDGSALVPSEKNGIRASLKSFLLMNVSSPIRQFLGNIDMVRQAIREFLDADYSESKDSLLLEFARFLSSKKNFADAYVAASLIAFTPLLTACLTNHKATVVIAPNDQDALLISRWFHIMRVHVPGKLSLLSFDNYLEFSLYPVTTVDFGFDYLGYAAFHAIARDIPVARKSVKEIEARAQVIRRGSVLPVYALPPETP